MVKKWIWDILVLLNSTVLWSSIVTTALPHQIFLPQAEIFIDHNRTYNHTDQTGVVLS